MFTMLTVTCIDQIRPNEHIPSDKQVLNLVQVHQIGGVLIMEERRQIFMVTKTNISVDFVK